MASRRNCQQLYPDDENEVIYQSRHFSDFRGATLFAASSSCNVACIGNTESFPNVEHSKMWSEPDGCALGADFSVIDSTFYFS